MRALDGLKNQVLFRLDDLGAHTPGVELCIRQMLELNFKISLGIVPAWLDQTTTTLVHDLAGVFADSIEVHQHGYRHLNYAQPAHSPYEFGPARSWAEQHQDINDGAQLLRATFHDLSVPAFSPPFGEYDATTVQVLEALDFAVLSGLWSDYSFDFPQASDALDLFEWNPRREKDVDSLELEWCHVQRYPLVVVVLHPRFMDSRSMQRRLAVLHRWLKDRQCVLFRDVC